jgi:hypothetical protein
MNSWKLGKVAHAEQSHRGSDGSCDHRRDYFGIWIVVVLIGYARC